MFDYDLELNDAIDVLTDYSSPVVKIREITNIKEKRKWMEYFYKGYSGSLIGLKPEIFGENCKFFVASVDGKDAGFIRITNYTNDWSRYYYDEVWNASDAYVKKPYRSKGVLRQLLAYVIDNCNVVSVRLETERLNDYHLYYKTLGFTYAWSIYNCELSIAVFDKLKEAAEKRNKEFNENK